MRQFWFGDPHQPAACSRCGHLMVLGIEDNGRLLCIPNECHRLNASTTEG